jgi:hypothetical protein
MKSAFLMTALALTLISCAKKAPLQQGEPGSVRTFNPALPGTNETNAVKDICGALEEKNRQILDYVDRDVLQVTYKESSCGGKLSDPVAESVKVRNMYGHLEFQNATNNFGLPEVELLSSGLMKEICANAGNLTNPMPAYVGSRTAIEFRESETSDCRNDSQHKCIVVFKGRISNDDSTYTVDESTLIRFETARGGRVGFYTFKSVKSYSNCADGKFRTKIATFDN